jgi:hypothetical protein
MAPLCQEFGTKVTCVASISKLLKISILDLWWGRFAGEIGSRPRDRRRNGVARRFEFSGFCVGGFAAQQGRS